MTSRPGWESGKHLKLDDAITFTLEAGEAIGYPANPEYPLAPILTAGYILYMKASDAKAYLMTLTDADLYIGISEIAAKIGENITIRRRGIVWLVPGSVAVTAGAFVCAEDAGGEQAGDIRDWVGHTDAVAGDAVNSIIGRALRAGGARSGATIAPVPVLLFG